MICPNCGTENKDDVSFCQFCGQRFAPKQNPNAEDSQQQNYYSQQDNHTWNNQQFDDQNYNYNNQNNNWNNSNNHWNTQNDSWNSPNNNWNNQMPPQQPYNYNRQPANGFGIASLVIGILSIIPCCLFPYFAIPMTIIGLVLGIIGMKKPYGRGLSMAGLVINIVFLIFSIIWLIICLYVYVNTDLNTYYNSINSFY